jgi:RNA polymerase sigma-70 factor (ECF subfamily)
MDDGAGSRAFPIGDATPWAGNPESAAAGRGETDPLAALAAEAGRGQTEAVERLVAALRPRLTRIALAVGAPPDDVPDLVQETLVAALRALPRFDPGRGRVEAWAATILVRRIRNLARGHRRMARALAAFGRPQGTRARLEGHAATASADVAALDARLTLARLLEALTVEQREIVALYEIAEWSAEDVAAALGIAPTTVRSIARDARRRLAQEAQRLDARHQEARR